MRFNRLAAGKQRDTTVYENHLNSRCVRDSFIGKITLTTSI